jgi:hypothetical protein
LARSGQRQRRAKTGPNFPLRRRQDGEFRFKALHLSSYIMIADLALDFHDSRHNLVRIFLQKLKV